MRRGYNVELGRKAIYSETFGDLKERLYYEDQERQSGMCVGGGSAQMMMCCLKRLIMSSSSLLQWVMGAFGPMEDGKWGLSSSFS